MFDVLKLMVALFQGIIGPEGRQGTPGVNGAKVAYLFYL